jgi:hypothetical protein
VLRIGRDAVEWWSRASEGRMLLRQQPLQLPQGPDPSVLPAALAALFKAQDEPARRSIVVVLESAWSPAMLLPAGQVLWSTRRLQALLRHRLGDLYGGMHDLADNWDLRVDHRAGEAQALGHGLAPSVKAAVMQSCTAAGWRVTSVQPALAWGLQRLAPAVRRASDGWWLWVEQDRAIVCRLQRGRVTALNAGAPVPGDDAHAQRLVAIEARRCGIELPTTRAIIDRWGSATSTSTNASMAATSPAEAAA